MTDAPPPLHQPRPRNADEDAQIAAFLAAGKATRAPGFGDGRLTHYEEQFEGMSGVERRKRMKAHGFRMAAMARAKAKREAPDTPAEAPPRKPPPRKPPAPPAAPRRKPARRTDPRQRREKTIQMIRDGMTVAEVAEKMGIQCQSVRRTLQLFAPDLCPRASKGKVTAEERAEIVRLYRTGLSLEEVGRLVGRRHSTCGEIVSQDAPDARRKPNTNARTTARQKRCYEMRVQENMGWAEIGEKAGMTKTGARTAACAYAEQNDLPPPRPQNPSQLARHPQQKQAYELRGGGLEWSVVAARLGYAAGGAAATAARAHAARHGLPWPPKERDDEQP